MERTSKRLKKDDKIRIEFEPLQCPENLDNEELSRKERAYLKQFLSLNHAWGYRMGPENKHTEFEHMSHHQDLVLVQGYSDVLFRSLSSLEQESPIIFPWDILKKFKSCWDLEEYKEKISPFILSFISQNEVKFMELAFTPIGEKNSGTFIGIITSARALVLISLNRCEEAYELFESFIDCYK